MLSSKTFFSLRPMKPIADLRKTYALDELAEAQAPIREPSGRDAK